MAITRMKTAAEYYDEAIARADRRFSVSYIIPSERRAIIREEGIAAIEAAVAEAYEHGFNVASGYEMTRSAAAVAEERARCLGIVRKHWVREPAATEIERGD